MFISDSTQSEFVKCAAIADKIMSIYGNVLNLAGNPRVNLLSQVKRFIRAVDSGDLTLSLHELGPLVANNKKLLDIASEINDARKQQSIWVAYKRADELLLSIQTILGDIKRYRMRTREEAFSASKASALAAFNPPKSVIAHSGKLKKLSEKISKMNALVGSGQLRELANNLSFISSQLAKGEFYHTKKELQRIAMKVAFSGSNPLHDEIVNELTSTLDVLNKLSRRDSMNFYADGLLDQIIGGARKCASLLDKARVAVKFIAQLHPELAGVLKLVLTAFGITMGISTYGSIQTLPETIKRLDKIAHQGLFESKRITSIIGYANSNVVSVLIIAFKAVLAYTSIALAQSIKLREERAQEF